ncbi:MAG: carboxypeptidase-like regulatory domain-containing protein, partial [Candidatus Rokuibacteriota bacterium]
VFGQVYEDENLNGRFDGEDRPLPDVVIRLDGGRHRRVTDDQGRYEFSAVEAGSHTVDVAGETVRADLTLLEDASHPVQLPAMSRMQIDFRVAANRSITGVVFADRNANGAWDAGEEGLPDVRLYVAGGRDALSFHDGSFRLGDVPPGTRVLLVDRTSLPPQLELPPSMTLVIEADRDPAPVEIAVPVTGRPVTRKRFSDG